MHRRGRLCTVHLLVLTTLDQLLFILKALFTSFTKQATLMRRSTVLSLPLQLVSPDKTVGASNPLDSFFESSVIMKSFT
jgi:hypothetical protein